MRPQLRMTEITLDGHPLDGWRRALESLIAAAPGTEIDVAWHLQDVAAKHLSLGLAEPSKLQRAAISRLIIVSDTLAQDLGDRDILGFTRLCRLIGSEPADRGSHALRPAHQPDTASAVEHRAPSERLANSPSVANPEVPADPSAPELQAPPPGATKHEPGHLSAPQSSAAESHHHS